MSSHWMYTQKEEDKYFYKDEIMSKRNLPICKPSYHVSNDVEMQVSNLSDETIPCNTSKSTEKEQLLNENLNVISNNYKKHKSQNKASISLVNTNSDESLQKSEPDINEEFLACFSKLSTQKKLFSEKCQDSGITEANAASPASLHNLMTPKNSSYSYNKYVESNVCDVSHLLTRYAEKYKNCCTCSHDSSVNKIIKKFQPSIKTQKFDNYPNASYTTNEFHPDCFTNYYGSEHATDPLNNQLSKFSFNNSSASQQFLNQNFNIDNINAEQLPQPMLMKTTSQSCTPYSLNHPYYQSTQNSHNKTGAFLANTSSSSAASSAFSNKPTFCWNGELPHKKHKDPVYSNKVFLGGLPWDVTEQGLYRFFKQYGQCTFEWPGKDHRSTRHPPKGYVYLIFESEKSVKNLLMCCESDEDQTQFYFNIKTNGAITKAIQVIPWILTNSSFLKSSGSDRLDATKTVFAGGLHGKITAENLALVFDELFGGVIYAGIDTDKHKYPIGSGRVTFNNEESYRKAILASFVEINGKHFSKKVQIDPYLEESVCMVCQKKSGPFFCKEFACLKYYCKICWIKNHTALNNELAQHKPITRQNQKSIFDLMSAINQQQQHKINCDKYANKSQSSAKDFHVQNKVSPSSAYYPNRINEIH